MASRGLKSKIAWHVVLLLLISAIITDILVVLVMQSVILRHEAARGRKIIERTGALLLPESLKGLPLRPSDPVLMLAKSELTILNITDADGTVLYGSDNGRYSEEFLKEQINSARRDHQTIVQEHDYVWHIFWWQPRSVTVTAPIYSGGRLNGFVSAMLPLKDVQEKISQYHKPIFFYIIINTVILTITGLYRIFRLYLRPIDRIVHQADEFHEDIDPFFVFRQEDNELNRLSSALNRMLSKIATDKKKLKETVMSLERANEELQNAQKEILRAEKMASVGRLAAGIAHEIGNPIGIVLGYIDMLKQNDLEEDEKSDFLKRTEKEVQRINTVIRQLLDLARPKTVQLQRATINILIRDIVEVMRIQPIMKSIDIQLELQAENEGIWCNEDQMRQVFLNLLLNAADAIHSGQNQNAGRIVVQTENVTSGTKIGGERLRIRLSDNGSGIGAEQLQNIFDPFYTTKEPGKGTGLGLAVSYMIIEGLGGTISAQSVLGQGATFEIDLPLSERQEHNFAAGIRAED